MDIYPEKPLTRKDTHTPVFIASLFATAKTCKQPKCPSIDERIKQISYTYTMEYYPDIKSEIMPFPAAQMGLKIIKLSEVSQRQISYDITYMWNLKQMIQMNLTTKQKQTHRLRE